MPEYLAPGVYIEETSFRAKSIEGVATSTAGFVGQCLFGPVNGTPTLATSFDEFQRHFGGIDNLTLAGAKTENYVAHAVKHFFDNGGRRVYISRIHSPTNTGGTPEQNIDGDRASGRELMASTARFKARYPGLVGNQFTLTVTGIRSGNILINNTVNGLRPGDVVEVTTGTQTTKSREIAETGANALTIDNIYIARVNSADPGQMELVKVNNATNAIEVLPNYAAVNSVQKVTLSLDLSSRDRQDNYQGLSTYPDSDVFIGRVLRHQDPDNGIEPPADRTARIFLEIDSLPGLEENKIIFARDFLNEILSSANRTQPFNGGSDGLVCIPNDYQGSGDGHTATGLEAIAEVEDIAIVAAPGFSALSNRDHRQTIRENLISHCQNLKYRFAILSAERDAGQGTIREIRAKHDSSYSALYYPWLVVTNPLNATGQGRDTIQIPPEGAVAGIYARSDIERGVHKAPANEVVRNTLRFSRNVNKRMQDVLNPEGINCLRFFEGRGNRVWGARTMSSDPEWTYLNVRRLFIFLEHSIDRGTQWAVFEPNNEELWLKIRLTIESFLTDVWRTGALMGTKPEEAFFVRCDRTTMSQGDLDNGRLVCLIGVAPTKPAEFVVFRIGQWTADASII